MSLRRAGRRFPLSKIPLELLILLVKRREIAAALRPDPIGRHVTLWKGQSNHDAEVVGVVSDSRVQAEPLRFRFCQIGLRGREIVVSESATVRQ